jgi:glutaredoxin
MSDIRGIDHTLLRRLQVQVGDRLEEQLQTRARARQPLSDEDVEAFKAEQGVAKTPQVFIGGERIGGSDDLETFLVDA